MLAKKWKSFSCIHLENIYDMFPLVRNIENFFPEPAPSTCCTTPIYDANCAHIHTFSTASSA